MAEQTVFVTVVNNGLPYDFVEWISGISFTLTEAIENGKNKSRKESGSFTVEEWVLGGDKLKDHFFYKNSKNEWYKEFPV